VSRPGRFTSRKDPVPIVREAGWASEAVWTSAENLAPTGIRSPDRQARIKSLYRLPLEITADFSIILVLRLVLCLHSYGCGRIATNEVQSSDDAKIFDCWY